MYIRRFVSGIYKLAERQPKMIETTPNYMEIFKFSYKKSIIENLECAASQNLTLFEDSIREAIKKFEKKHNKYCTKISLISEELEKIENSESEDNFDLQQKKYKLYSKQGDYYVECHWLNEQLKSLSEMQIINAFKNVEINIKEMLNIAYPKLSLKDFYRWESLEQFFKSNNIKLSTLEGYKEILELKNLNNTLKHNGLLNENIKKIEEFKEDEEFNFVNIINFYERVKLQIPIFLNRLSKEIENDLFNFDEERIEQIAKDLKQRMDEKDLKLLREKLAVD